MILFYEQARGHNDSFQLAIWFLKLTGSVQCGQ